MGDFRESIAWAAGVFEGEGCITTVPDPRLDLGMTDRDIVERFATVIGIGGVRLEPRRQGRKDLYRWWASSAVRVQAVLAMLWPWLGERRREKARECFSVMRARRPHNRYVWRCPAGHVYDEANTYRYKRGRMCRACRHARQSDKCEVVC